MGNKEFDPVDLLKGDDELLEQYLIASVEENDPVFLVKAVQNISKAYGANKIAEMTGLNRESLHKWLSDSSSLNVEKSRMPTLSTLMKVVDACGFSLTLVRKKTN